MDVLCVGTSLDGKPCTRHRAPGRDTCRWHHPEKIEERALALEERATALRATASTPA